MSDLIQSYKCAVEKLLSLARNVPDPRKRRGVRHKLDIVLTIFVLALLCDQNDFLRVEDWAKSEFETLSQIMDLPHGIPSHDTFMRVMGLLPVEAIESLFVAWIAECYPECSNHLAIDGKTVNGTVKMKDWETDQVESRQKKHAQNLVIFRHLVCGILRKHLDTKRMTVSMKRTHCRNSLEYRVGVLNQAFSMAA